MKTLYLVRHAKSSWEDYSKEDYQRELLLKGVKRTEKVARYLKDKEVYPDVIISSHAVRAFETARILAETLGYPLNKILLDESMYFSGADAMYNILSGVDDTKNSVMLVGHNPDMTGFANQFLEQKLDYMPTSAVVAVKFQTTRWHEIMLASREVDFTLIPKNL